ncbi:MAG: exonuclease subunit SbcD [Clostridiales bacterium]|nr:exonuclease subunit SbcD [Clostridiales bacterium]
MKILHTADLHLGKRLGKASRLPEQCDVIKELSEIAETENVDVVLIAGDIFDATVPPSDAEKVFYRGLLTLAERGRAVIALAGNHDDEKRMCAAKPLADLQNIVLAGEIDYTALGAETLDEPVPPASLFDVAAAADYLKKQRLKIIGRNGGVTIEKGEERVNVALVPYPSESRLSRWAEQDYSVPYPDRVKNTLQQACGFFKDGEYNILCTHLFLTKSEAEPLGGLLALPVSVLPEAADYIALGHVHKRYTVTKKPLAVYAGSPLQYAYDESRNKSVTIIDTATKSVTEHLLRSGKKLTETDAYNFDECMAKLEQFGADYVRIRYGGEPLGKTDTATIKAHPAFNDLVVTAVRHDDAVSVRRAHLSDGEIFEQYYKQRYGNLPNAELKAAFTELMEELKSE